MILHSPYFIIKSLQQKTLEKYSGYLKGKVIDAGCGMRHYRKYLAAGSQYIGMDESLALKADVVGRVTEIPFADGQFDSLLCTEVLEHLPEPEKAIKELSRVLKKGGYLYFSVPQQWCLHYEPDDYFRFTKYGIKYLLEKNGIKIVAIERIGGFFSLAGQRIVDIGWHLLRDCLTIALGLQSAERAASALCLPANLGFYLLGRLGDRIDKRDALGWAVLALK